MSSPSISIFEMIKIGVGPSSSHTMGPWKISKSALEDFQASGLNINDIKAIQIHLYGSMATTGAGHGTDMASVMGLTGLFYENMDTTKLPQIIDEIKKTKKLNLNQTNLIDFDYDKDIVWHYDEALPDHPNGQRIVATFKDGKIETASYYSIGGGFIRKAGEENSGVVVKNVPYDIKTGSKLLKIAKEKNVPLYEIILENELQFRTKQEIIDRANLLFNECFDAIYRGLSNPGGKFWGWLDIHKKANRIARGLLKDRPFPSSKEEFFETMKTIPNDFASVNSWISAFSIAVNEENASFGRIITAPTNGASGVMPGVLGYARFFLKNATPEKIMRYILVAGQIALIFKENATLSGAMGGCQAEVGVSASMNAAALADWLGGTNEQILDAGTIAMNGFLGLACDPVAGLVIFPCIDRNATASPEAVNSAYVAISNTAEGSQISLDAMVSAMWEISQDMNEKYRETAKGGLATSFFNDYPHLKTISSSS